MKRLCYTACAGDNFQGTITVHALPEEWKTLAQWCEALEDEGIQIEYQGEGLPSLTRKVMLALLRRKVARKGTSLEERQELHRRQKGKCEGLRWTALRKQTTRSPCGRAPRKK